MAERYVSISSLREGDRNVNVRFRVLKKIMDREVFSRRDLSKHRLVELLVGDETGTIILTLWDSDADKVEVDRNYRLIGGYVTRFRGSLRLNLSRRGRIVEE